MNLVGGVLGVIPPGVKKVADIVSLDDMENPLHVVGGALRFFLEIQLVTARAQARTRSVFQTFDGLGLLLVEIDQVLVEDAEDAIETAVDLFNETVLARLLNDTRDAGVDHGRGTARLGDQKIAD